MRWTHEVNFHNFPAHTCGSWIHPQNKQREWSTWIFGNQKFGCVNYCCCCWPDVCFRIFVFRQKLLPPVRTHTYGSSNSGMNIPAIHANELILLCLLQMLCDFCILCQFLFSMVNKIIRLSNESVQPLLGQINYILDFPFTLCKQMGFLFEEIIYHYIKR